MGDPKQDVNDLADLDSISDESLEELEALYEAEAAEYESIEEEDDYEEEVPEATKAAPSSGRGWLVLTVFSFTLALASTLVLTPAVTVQKDRLNKAVNAANKANLATTIAAQALTQGGSFAPLEKNINDVELAVTQLVSGSSLQAQMANALFANDSFNQDVLQKFATYKADSAQFALSDDDVTAAKREVAGVADQLSRTLGDSINFVKAIAIEGRKQSSGENKDKYLYLTSEASNLNGILGTMIGSMPGFFAGANANPQESLDRVNGFMGRLQESLGRIVSNSADVVGTAAEPLREQYSNIESSLSTLGDRVGPLADSQASLQRLRESNRSLIESVGSASNQGGNLQLVANASQILPLILAILGIFALWRFSQARASQLSIRDAGLEETLAEQQESILKLLDEMSALADGDLTVEAEVTDQITGAIADSVNFAVIEMRELVSQINRASIEVANESELAVSNAQEVSQSNASQAQQISTAAEQMQQVSESMRQMSEQANSSSTMAAESMQVAERGAQAVRDTISGMEDMREQIQDTSKRIKRLGESSQRIGDIVALIDDIAEQTNILSLNAAIQASMAGEAGRGFAVVSDEVQSLAERSTEATKKIAELVSTIQNDTNDAVLSMEKATQQVVSGTRVADSAGAALAEIESASKQLSELVEGISKGSNKHAETVTEVSQQVTQVSDSSTETSRKAQDSANSIAKLLELAKDLETSVSRFKLPAN
ncbi:MAG: methyl-accepting chemotaxis protein [Gammaproteobacteria bacterium]|nr:methyl-accepting chemotaxis protein [Gammaproteobacteria bacterium]